MKTSLTYAAAGLLAAGLLGSAVQAQVGGGPTFCALPGGEPGQVLHCDKIVFELKPRLAEKTQLPAKTPLDIKVCDDGTKVTDLKGEVVQHFGLEDGPKVRDLIKMTDVEYSAICSGFLEG